MILTILKTAHSLNATGGFVIMSLSFAESEKSSNFAGLK